VVDGLEDLELCGTDHEMEAVLRPSLYFIFKSGQEVQDQFMAQRPQAKNEKPNLVHTESSCSCGTDFTRIETRYRHILSMLRASSSSGCKREQSDIKRVVFIFKSAKT
jgi:hypothetical protein